MAQFARITLTNTNLTGATNFFTVKMKECSQGSLTTIQTGLTYSDFPYLVNLDDNFGSITCYFYNVSESTTGLVCSGQTFIGSPTPTPTISITPTNTPSVTPSSTGVTPTPSMTVSVTTTPSVTVTTTPSVTSSPSSTGVTPTPSVTVTTTPSVTPTPSITSTVTPSNTTTPTTTPSLTPTNTVTPTPTPSPPECHTIIVYTGDSLNNVCVSSNSLTLYSNDSENLSTGIDVYTDNCPIQGGTLKLDSNIFIVESGSTNVYRTFSAGTISYVGTCSFATPTTTPTPTMTPTVTVSVTPTITPTPSNSSPTGVTLNMGLSYKSGSTIADYSVSASTQVDENTTISFKNVLYDTSDNAINISTGVTINSGNLVGNTRVTLGSVDYSTVKGYETVISGITTLGTNVKTVDKFTEVDFSGKSNPTMVNWIFTGCCIEDGNIEIQVPTEATLTGGWVDNGWGVLHHDRCYMAHQSGGTGNDGQYFGADAKLCSSTYGCPSCTDYIKIQLRNCCDGSLLTTTSILTTPLSVGDIVAFNNTCHTVQQFTFIDSVPTETIDETYASCQSCFSGNPSFNPCASVTPTPTATSSVTPTLTPTVSMTPTPSVDLCANGLDCDVSVGPCNLACYSNQIPYIARRASNCCDGTTSSVMVPESWQVNSIFVWNDECWTLGVETTDNDNYVLNSTLYGTCEECVACNDIDDCNGDWITCKVKPCCDTSPELPQGAITFEGNACIGDGIIHNNICYKIINTSNGQGGGALVVDESDIIEDVCNYSACTACTITLQSCTMSNGSGDINYFPNYIRVNQSQITQSVSTGDVCLFSIPVQTGSGSLSNTLYVEQCYTVVADDENVPLVSYSFQGVSSQGCSDASGKCPVGYVGVQGCGDGQTVIIGIDSLNTYWNSLTVGDVFSSVPITSNPYTSTGFLGNDASSCYTIVGAGTEITVAQQYAGGGTWTTSEGATDVVDCNDDECVRCLSGVTVTNDDSIGEDITIVYYRCDNTYVTTNVPYNSTITLGCINILSLYQMNFLEIANDNIQINYNLSNNCE